jgi:hypothetical protein
MNDSALKALKDLLRKNHDLALGRNLNKKEEGA